MTKKPTTKKPQNVHIRAPYQFVPFSETILTAYQNEDELPEHDKIRPDLKTGEIKITLRAETPVFISDGIEHGDKIKRFFRLADDDVSEPVDLFDNRVDAFS